MYKSFSTYSVLPGALLKSAFLCAPLWAQDTSEPPPAEPSSEAEIVVTAPTERGGVNGQGVPDVRLSPEDIAAYSAPDIGSLLSELAPQSGERPVLLVNGKRISSPNEIAKLPPEAIERVDILPENVALNLGYRADQKVVNIVLKVSFAAVTARGSLTTPTQGGQLSHSLAANIVRINQDGRMALDIERTQNDALTSDERALAGPRTLVPARTSLALGAAISRPVADNINATASLRHQRNESDGFNGLDPFAATLLRGTSRSRSTDAAVNINGKEGRWSWTFNGQIGRSVTHSLTALPATGAGTSNIFAVASKSLSGAADLFVQGPLTELPAGPLGLVIRSGLSVTDTQNYTTSGDLRSQSDITTQMGTSSANFSFPVASRGNEVLTALGDLMLNLNLAQERNFGIGRSQSLGGGFSWAPTPSLRLSGTLTRAGGLPPVVQRNDPLLLTPNVPIFDFARGETVLVSLISGGNPNLRADERRSFALSGSWKPYFAPGLSLNFSYNATTVADPVRILTGPSPEFEAAFPSRFVRDASGRLTSIDMRALNFASAAQRSINTNVFWALPLGGDTISSKSPNDFDEVMEINEASYGDGPSPKQGIGQTRMTSNGGTNGRRGLSGGMRSGRLLLSLQHVWRLEDSLTIANGLPPIDLLEGSALAGTGTGRHQLNVQARLRVSAFGATLDAKWQQGGSLIAGTERLDFADLLKVNAGLSANLGQMVRGQHLAKTLRAEVQVSNLFNARQQVTDRLGATPLAYAPALIDPVGRNVMLSLRKQF
ncbi:hypothetical protein [Sphingorhabdus contaminans]|uniref:TonB-dependent receptor n=1 Tax=Sphingorhabdus contaminans TaxID=1343899 RepID=A0A553WA83_9SPHN|nr:hypothetical protein [Sphingorhabdus contaminans]TSB01600.1 hypothetical protein FOM92_10470 [Sphingorhabdus contaminans]